MSYSLIPIDRFMHLDIPTLTYALFLFQKEIDETIACLIENPEARADEKLQDNLLHAMTLRKVFQGRIDELKAEDEALKYNAEQGRSLVGALS